MGESDEHPMAAEYAPHFIPRLSEDEAKSVPVMGWNLQCAGCRLYGATWRAVSPGIVNVRHVALCAPCEDLRLEEQRRHRTAISRITGGKYAP